MDLLDPGIMTAAPTARERLHDLRTLFAVIASGGHMLEDSIEPEHHARIVAAIEDAAMRGGDIATALLAASFQASPEEYCELATRIARLKPLLETLVGAGVRLRVDAALRPTLVRCRAERLDHILLELISNARAAMEDGGDITLRARRVGTHVRILVADHGPGIPPEQLRQLLGPLDALPVGPHGGGLRQIRSFAREADACLGIRSRRGKGTVVALTMPVMLPERIEANVQATKEPADAE